MIGNHSNAHHQCATLAEIHLCDIDDKLLNLVRLVVW